MLLPSLVTKSSSHLLRYGRRSVSIDLEADQIVHHGGAFIANEEAAVRHAILHPLGTPPLSQIVKPGERIAIIVNDITRLTRTELMLPPIIETLNGAGIPDSDIFIVFALGIHLQQTAEERRSIIGDGLFHRIRNFDHICDDDSSLVTVGKT